MPKQIAALAAIFMPCFPFCARFYDSSGAGGLAVALAAAPHPGCAATPYQTCLTCGTADCG
jgi:hypothetical protein